MNPTFDSMMGAMGFKRVKARRCAQCQQEFMPFRPLQKACSTECAILIANRKSQKADKLAKAEERKAIKARKEKIKSRSDWAREAQAAVNAFVRERDKDLPCISCGRFHQGQWHAGHYLSRGAHPELAYEELNLAKQCQPCNTHLSGNQINFRKGLIQRIGIDAVEWLEGPHDPSRPSIESLKAIRDNYRAKLKALRAAK